MDISSNSVLEFQPQPEIAKTSIKDNPMRNKFEKIWESCGVIKKTH